MKRNKQIERILAYIESSARTGLTFDQSAIKEEYEELDETQPTLAIKILAFAGGLLASLAFVGLLLLEISDKKIGMSFFGVIFIASSVVLNKYSNTIFTDTLSISTFISGFLLLGFGLAGLLLDPNTIWLIVLIFALGSQIFTRDYILTFLCVFITSCSIIALILSNNLDYLLIAYASALSILSTYFISKEGRIIASFKSLSTLYNPVRIGLLFSFVSVLVFLGKKGLAQVSAKEVWIASVVFIAAIIYLGTLVLEIFGVKSSKQKLIACFCTGAILSPTLFAPAISGAVLILLLSFYVNHKTGIALGIITVVYFISQYYYDLTFTLLTKSVLLFASGILFLAIYLFIHNKLHKN